MRRRPRQRWLLLGSLAVLLGAVVATPESVPEVPSLQAEFDRIVSRGQSAQASWSALAVSLDHGDTLFLRRPDARLAPASNIKLFTTAAALRVLGRRLVWAAHNAIWHR